MVRESYELSILSGDNDGEMNYLESILPKNTELLFNQKPESKLAFIQENQDKEQQVMMVGDGLNDSQNQMVDSCRTRFSVEERRQFF